MLLTDQIRTRSEDVIISVCCGRRKPLGRNADGVRNGKGFRHSRLEGAANTRICVARSRPRSCGFVRRPRQNICSSTSTTSTFIIGLDLQALATISRASKASPLRIPGALNDLLTVHGTAGIGFDGAFGRSGRKHEPGHDAALRPPRSQ